MSLSRARKKFWGSISRRQKLKISEQKDVEHLSFLRSLSPLPSNANQLFSLSDLPIDHMQSSMSLPDQLDQSEATAVSKVSSKSLSYIGNSTPNFETPKHVGYADSPTSYFFDYSNSTLPLASVSSWPNSVEDVRMMKHKGRLGSSESFSDRLGPRTVSEAQPTSANSSDTLLRNLAEQRNSNYGVLHSVQKIKTPLNNFVNSSSSDVDQEPVEYGPSSPTSLVDIGSGIDDLLPGYRCLNLSHNDIVNFNHENTNGKRVFMSEALGMFADSYESFDEVFEQELGESLTAIPESEVTLTDSSKTKSCTLSTNDIDKTSTEDNFYIAKTCNDNPPEMENYYVCLPDSLGHESSIRMKIKFFETNAENNERNVKSKRVPIPLVQNNRNASCVPTHDQDNQIPVSTHSRTRSLCFSSDYEHGIMNHEEVVNQTKTVPSYRLFTSFAVPRKRLNFSRFKRSDSIPEAAIVCACGEHCADMCRAPNVKVTRNPSVNREGTSSRSDKSSLERITHCQVCHHSQCTDMNGDRPLLLCQECDLDIHTKTPGNRHFVLNHKQKVAVTKHNQTGQARDDQSGSLQTVVTRISNEEIKGGSQRRAKEQRKEDVFPLSHTLPRYKEILTNTGNTGSHTAISKKRGENATSSFSFFTLKFGGSFNNNEELVVLPASSSVTLREAIEPVLELRNMTINSVNVYIEMSSTALPMESNTGFLAEHTLEVKEKDIKDLDSPLPVIPLPFYSGSRKSLNKTGRNSRRESTGLVSLLLEAPPPKQRRGSLQLPFREHFFAKAESKSNELIKVYDESAGGPKGRAGRNSTDDIVYSPTGSAAPLTELKRNKSNKHRFGSSSKEKERHDQLTALLNQYSLHGLPSCVERFDDSILELETSWKAIISDHENMTKKQQEHQEAVWELLQTEVSYIKQIRVIIDVFHNCLINVQQESYLNEIHTERLFSNIDEVFECNCMFWERYLLPILQHSRESKKPLDPLLSKEGFVDHFPVLFQVYFKYLKEHKSCLDYTKACMDNSDLFKILIQWAESQKQCNRLRLTDILVQPMPRLLRYSLLLIAILKNTEIDQDRIDLQTMIQSVDNLCKAANSSLRRREEYERLEAIRKVIEPLDAVEAPNDECVKIIQDFAGSFNLLTPMLGLRDGPRSLLFQSNLRMKEAQNIKMEVDCLLFTDLLLVCKSNKKRFKIIRPPMRLDHLVVCELKDKGSFLLIYVNEYRVPISAFTFHSDPGAIRGWLDKFRQAQKEFKETVIEKSTAKNRSRSDTTSTQGDMDNISMSSLPSYLEVAPSTISRSGSSDSLDHFLPNIPTVNDTGSEIARSNSMGNFQNYPPRAANQSNILHASSDSKLGMPLSLDYAIFNESHENEQDDGHNSHTLHQILHPSLNIVAGYMSPDTSIVADSPSNSLTAQTNSWGLQESADEGKSESFSHELSNKFTNEGLSQSPMTHDIGDEEVLTKINFTSRRTEKRYRTADEIPDINNTKWDTNIHKWSSLRMDDQIVNPNSMGSNGLSTDSLQSYHSSSGVSSTGSLHLPLETNEESNDNFNDGDVFNDNYNDTTDKIKHFSLDNTLNFGVALDEVDGDNSSMLMLSESKHSKSKSTSDLVEVFNQTLQVSPMTDGIASVAVAENAFHRKLTHLDIAKLKKIREQFLFDANTESSDV